MPELVKKVNNDLVKRFNVKINKKLGLAFKHRPAKS
jgi:hypothetical protein